MLGVSTCLAAGEGAPSRSASAIVAAAVCGYHVLEIVDYSRTKEGPYGQCFHSRPFRVGGRTWFVEYHPKWEATDYISLFLALDDAVAEAVNAQVKISLLDQYGKPVPSYSRTTEVVNFSEQRSWGFAKFIEREVLEKSKHLRNDSFAVRFDVTVMKDIQTKETAVVMAPPPSNMHQHFGDILLTREGADVRFRVGNETFSAHRLVLAVWSPVFKSKLYGEASVTSSTIPIDDMEAEVFRALLTFMYTDTLPEMKEQEESAMAQQLLVAADKYHLERLKLICEEKLCKHIDMDSTATILALAKQHKCHALKEACLEFIQSSVNLDTVMGTDGFEYLTRSRPTFTKELMPKIVPHWLLRTKSRS